MCFSESLTRIRAFSLLWRSKMHPEKCYFRIRKTGQSLQGVSGHQRRLKPVAQDAFFRAGFAVWRRAGCPAANFWLPCWLSKIERVLIPCWFGSIPQGINQSESLLWVTTRWRHPGDWARLGWESEAAQPSGNFPSRQQAPHCIFLR